MAKWNELRSSGEVQQMQDSQQRIYTKLYIVIACLVCNMLVYLFPWVNAGIAGFIEESYSLWSCASQFSELGQRASDGGFMFLSVFIYIGNITMLILMVVSIIQIRSVLNNDKRTVDLSATVGPIFSIFYTVLIVITVMATIPSIERNSYGMANVSITAWPVICVGLSIAAMAVLSRARQEPAASYRLDQTWSVAKKEEETAQPEKVIRGPRTTTVKREAGTRRAAALPQNGLPIVDYDTDQRLQPVEFYLDKEQGTIALLVADYQAGSENDIRALRTNIIFHTIFDDDIRLEDVPFTAFEEVKGKWLRTESVQVELPQARLKEIRSASVEITRIADSSGSAAVEWASVPSSLSVDDLIALRNEFGKDAFRQKKIGESAWYCVCGCRNGIEDAACARCRRARDRNDRYDHLLRCTTVRELMEALEGSGDPKLMDILKKVSSYKAFLSSEQTMEMAFKRIRELEDGDEPNSERT